MRLNVPGAGSVSGLVFYHWFDSTISGVDGFDSTMSGVDI